MRAFVRFGVPYNRGASGRSAGYDLGQVGRSDTSLCPGAHSGLERLALLLVGHVPEAIPASQLKRSIIRYFLTNRIRLLQHSGFHSLRAVLMHSSII